MKSETGRFGISGSGNCQIKLLSMSDYEQVKAKVGFVKLSCGTNHGQYLSTPREVELHPSTAAATNAYVRVIRSTGSDVIPVASVWGKQKVRRT